jgi:L,D-peptidoglycan transpeptidase YkuD (ErfK/YbiS/YcfS/YnhG family)
METGKAKALPARARVAAHRARLRRQGLRPVQIWVPDVRAPEFARAAHEQSAAIAASETDADDQAFVDAITWDWAAEEEGGAGSAERQ